MSGYTRVPEEDEEETTPPLNISHPAPLGAQLRPTGETHHLVFTPCMYPVSVYQGTEEGAKFFHRRFMDMDPRYEVLTTYQWQCVQRCPPQPAVPHDEPQRLNRKRHRLSLDEGRRAIKERIAASSSALDAE